MLYLDFYIIWLYSQRSGVGEPRSLRLPGGEGKVVRVVKVFKVVKEWDAGGCKSASCGSLCFICLIAPEAEGARRPGLSIIGVLRKPLVGGGDQSDRSDGEDAGGCGVREDAGEIAGDAGCGGVLPRGEGVGTGGCVCKGCMNLTHWGMVGGVSLP